MLYNLSRHTVFLVIMLAAGLAVSGCHTIQGVGADIQDGGRALERAVD